MDIEKTFQDILHIGFGLDVNDPNLIDTPKRLTKMYKDFFQNTYKSFGSLTTFPNTEKYNQIILLDKIHFTSICSHHFLPFSGYAWFAYIPNEKLLGASKPARVIEHYSKRPQLQETLCQQVVDFIEKELNPQGIMLVMRAIHGCMSCRGINQYHGAGMTTSAITGVFQTESAKNEVLSLISLSLKMDK